MVRKTAVLLILVLQSLLVFPQGENNNWTFGNGCGISFNSGLPVFFESDVYSKEGTATISDPFGNLIFYTSGNMVWDREHQGMPTGNILGNGAEGSGTQAVLVLKSLSNASQYYVFTLDPQEVAISGSPKMRYSIVDMTLNDGLGDVHPVWRNIVLDDEMEERMFAVPTEDCGYWIVGHKRHSDQYVTFKLTEAGISGPFYSSGVLRGNYYGSDVGEIKISPDKTKIAINFTNVNMATVFDVAYFGLEVADFDITTGLVSGAIALDSAKQTFGYGLSFSPDNSKLYAAHESFDMNLHQYDMALFPDADAMRAGKLQVYHIDTMDPYFDGQYGMRIGPDNKIYVVSIDGYVRCIEKPNESGADCDYNISAFAIPPEHYFYGPDAPFYSFNLGNPTTTVTYKDTLPGNNQVVNVCFRDSVTLQVDNNLLNYTWNDGQNGYKRTVYEPGIYYCISSRLCTVRIDTFNVHFVKGDYYLGSDTTLCPGDSLKLSVSGEGFTWQDGSTDATYLVKTPGTYTVTINKSGCFYADTILVNMYRGSSQILPADTVICNGEYAVLNITSDPAGDILWDNGSSSGTRTVSVSGTYTAMVSSICGVYNDTSRVRVQDCNCRPAIPNAFSPNGDGINDVFMIKLNCLEQVFRLSIYNRYGERIFVSYRQEDSWDGSYRDGIADTGTYFYQLQYQTPNGRMEYYKGDLILLR